ncbi:MAG: DUF1080 domain-containing protein [Pirellulales bacterium]|nr:DUF1080 domain-containing protein [Pirellulales bacterium]
MLSLIFGTWTPWIALLVITVPSAFVTANESAEDGWIRLFDGKSLGDWKPNEHPENWSVQDGCIVASGPRSHLFYMGKENEFTNFHLRAEVKADPGSNSGIFFHTKWQDEGWPEHGYESQVNISHGDPVKSGSLYNTVKLYQEDIAKVGLKDNIWWTQEIIVQGKHVLVKLNGKTVIDYTEPDDKQGTVRLGQGTFALQAHDPKSRAFFRKIEVKRLP